MGLGSRGRLPQPLTHASGDLSHPGASVETQVPLHQHASPKPLGLPVPLGGGVSALHICAALDMIKLLSSGVDSWILSFQIGEVVARLFLMNPAADQQGLQRLGG